MALNKDHTLVNAMGMLQHDANATSSPVAADMNVAEKVATGALGEEAQSIPRIIVAWRCTAIIITDFCRLCRAGGGNERKNRARRRYASKNK